MPALPHMLVFIADWKAETRLKRVSLAAEGLWFRICQEMHESPRHGVLLDPDGVPLTNAEDIAAVLGRTVHEVEGPLAEIIRRRVCSVTGGEDTPDSIASVPAGAIYSRKMVRDEEKRQKLRENGRKGGEEKARRQAEPSSKPPSNGSSKQPSKSLATASEKAWQKSSPIELGSSSSSVSSSSEILSEEEGMQGEKPTDRQSARDLVPAEASPPRRHEQILAVFEHYRGHHPKCKPLKPSPKGEWKAISEALESGWTVEDLCDAIDGMHITPHNIGENVTGTKYLGIHIAMRQDNVLRFAETAREGPRPVMSQREQKGVRAGLSWLAKHKQRDAHYTALDAPAFDDVPSTGPPGPHEADRRTDAQPRAQARPSSVAPGPWQTRPVGGPS